jgi:hypothetical protein
MSTLIRYARQHAVAFLALFFALSLGTAWAVTAPKNSVRSSSIVDRQVKEQDLALDSVRSKQIRNRQVLARHLGSGIPFDMGPPRGDQTESNAADLKRFQVECPTNQVPVTGAAFVRIDGGAPTEGNGKVAITTSTATWHPAFDFEGWYAEAVEINGGLAAGQEWSLSVGVICADVRE